MDEASVFENLCVLNHNIKDLISYKISNCFQKIISNNLMRKSMKISIKKRKLDKFTIIKCM